MEDPQNPIMIEFVSSVALYLETVRSRRVLYFTYLIVIPRESNDVCVYCPRTTQQPICIHHDSDNLVSSWGHLRTQRVIDDSTSIHVTNGYTQGPQRIRKGMSSAQQFLMKIIISKLILLKIRVRNG
jgi:hypothetical protein